MCVCVLSCIWLFVSTHQAPLFVEFYKQEDWSELLFPIPGELPNPGIKLVSLASPALAGRFFTTVPSEWNWEDTC